MKWRQFRYRWRDFYVFSTGTAPIVISVSIDVGDTAGGTPIEINGSGFTGATGATVGGVALTSFLVVSDILITGVTGAHALGVVDVSVQHPNGTGTLLNGYEYFNPSALAKCIFWLRADLGVTESGGRVDSWATQVDAGDAGKTVSSTGANRPVKTPSNASYNNKPTISTDGASQRLLAGGSLGGTWSAAAESQANERFFVGHMANGTTQSFVDGESGSNRHFVRSNSGGTNTWQFGCSAAITAAAASNAPNIISVAFDTTNSALYAGDHNTPDTTGSVGTHTLDSCFIFCLGTGANNAASGAHIAEVADFNDKLTDAERLRLFKYAGGRYALSYS